MSSSRGRGGGRGQTGVPEIREETQLGSSTPPPAHPPQAPQAEQKKKKVRIDVGEMDAALYKVHGRNAALEERQIAQDPNRTTESRNPSWEIDPTKLSLCQKIGHGTFGTVHRGTYDGRDVAVKIFNWDEGVVSTAEALYHRQKFMREVDIMSQLSHPNVTRFVGAWAGGPEIQIPSTDMGVQGTYTLKASTHMLLMEYISEGSLRALWINARRAGRRRLGYQAVMQFALDTARGLAYLHSKQICHRDLKPDNLLLDHEMRIKIADFGESRVQAVQHTDMSKRTGTLGYMAPEVLAGSDSTGYNHKCDVFSYGMVLWEIFAMDFPFAELRGELNIRDMARLMCEDGMRPKIPKWCPKFLKDLISRCWDGDPAKRPEMADVISMIEAQPFSNCSITVSSVCDQCCIFCSDVTAMSPQ